MISVSRLQYGLLLGISLACTSGVCQSVPQPGVPAANSEDGIQLSLQQAIRMALEKNLDIQLEQIDQAVADFSVTRTNGGGTPRQINYNIAETPAGAVMAAMPLLASTGSTLSPNGIEPSGITIPSSYDVGHVLEAQHSLSNCRSAVLNRLRGTRIRP
jgi:hypothetical protein